LSALVQFDDELTVSPPQMSLSGVIDCKRNNGLQVATRFYNRIVDSKSILE